jgi:hypothetical protein
VLADDIEFDALGVDRVVGGIAGGAPDHEWSQRYAAESALGDPVIEVVDCGISRHHIDPGKRDEPVGVPLDECGDDVIGDECLSAAREFVESGDHRPFNAAGIQVGEDLFVAAGEARSRGGVLLGGDGLSAEYPQIVQQLVGHVRRDVLHDLAGWHDRRPHVNHRDETVAVSC